MGQKIINDMPADWLTPDTEEVLHERLAIAGALSKSNMSEDELKRALRIQPFRSVAHDVGLGKKLFGDVLTRESPEVVDCRRHIAFKTALHELTSDGLVEAAHTVGEVFHVSGKQATGGGTRVGFSARFGPVERGGYALTSRARGWSEDEHEAFDPRLYQARSSRRLLTADGVQLLQESIDAYRTGRFLSSAIVLGVFVETCWFEAARLAVPKSTNVSNELQKPFPSIAAIQNELIAFFKSDPKRTRNSTFLAGNLDTWATSTRQVRNFAAHGQILSATSGRFSSAAGAMRILDTYRSVEELDQALREFNL